MSWQPLKLQQQQHHHDMLQVTAEADAAFEAHDCQGLLK